MFNEAQQNKAKEIWNFYLLKGKKFRNAGQEYTQEELDLQREEQIPIAQNYINDYFDGKLSLQNFKTEIDGLNKRHRLWGFKGINGQMFFNMLYNLSSGAGLLDKLDSILKQTLVLPNDIIEAKSKIELLASFSDSLANYVSDKRQAPRSGSCIFFLSYFWQIQDRMKWPIYYRSMVDVLQDVGIWSPSGDLSKDYEEFYNLNMDLKSLVETISRNSYSLWDIEHALWVWGLKNEVQDEKLPGDTSKIPQPLSELPSSFIPPVVSVIPLLARNDSNIENVCKSMGISVEKAFEDRISILFKIFGYKVESLGQGLGRVPDGIAICSEFHYSLIFDAKVRKDGYSIGTDDRAIREYIFQETEKLKRLGIRNVYYLIISSSFSGDFDDIIRTLKMETEIREIIFIEASALLSLLEEKLRNTDLDLGPKGIQNLFAQSGIITNSDVKEFLGI